jgi:hypothetical protein
MYESYKNEPEVYALIQQIKAIADEPQVKVNK